MRSEFAFTLMLCSNRSLFFKSSCRALLASDNLSSMCLMQFISSFTSSNSLQWGPSLQFSTSGRLVRLFSRVWATLRGGSFAATEFLIRSMCLSLSAISFFVKIRFDLRFLCASWHSLILSVKALLVLFQWTDMSEAALLIRLFTSYLSCLVADLPAACDSSTLFLLNFAQD